MEEFFKGLIDFEKPVTKPRYVWFFILGFFWMGWISEKADAAYVRSKAEVANRMWGTQWWYANEPDNAKSRTMALGVLALAGVFFVAHLIATIQVSWLQKLSHMIEEKSFAKKSLLLEKNSEAQAMQSKAAHSKKELIVRLGSIDQFIRVLENETDPARRTVALQAASSELTALSAKLATGEILPEASDSPEVQQAAKETSFDLAKVGLAEDRLNRDLRRMFKLADAPLALPEQRA
jgi:hypothetical protein